MTDLRPHLTLRDLIAEALASLTARPGRAVLTALGTVMGVAALVATLGLSKTAGNQIVGRFDALAATDIVVTPKAAAAGRASAGSGLPCSPRAGAPPRGCPASGRGPPGWWPPRARRRATSVCGPPDRSRPRPASAPPVSSPASCPWPPARPTPRRSR